MKVLVLMGGRSSEREISLRSGRAVAEGLKRAGYEVFTYDFLPSEGRDIVDLITSREFVQSSVIFIALHGVDGEDGKMQAVFDLLGKPYTGSGVVASALCMDKILTKIVFESRGIRTPEWFTVRDDKVDHAALRSQIEDIGGYPIVVKPADQGSTIGVSIIRDDTELQSALRLAQRYSKRLLFEKYIPGRELSVAIVGDQVLPVIEIEPEGGFYDYERKYTKGKTRYTCPAAIDEKVASLVMEEAYDAYEALGCEGFARVDLRLSEENTPFFLEINTIPGMTETSLVPMAAEAKGYSFSDLVDLIVKQALAKNKVGV